MKKRVWKRGSTNYWFGWDKWRQSESVGSCCFKPADRERRGSGALLCVRQNRDGIFDCGWKQHSYLNQVLSIMVLDTVPQKTFPQWILARQNKLLHQPLLISGLISEVKPRPAWARRRRTHTVYRPGRRDLQQRGTYTEIYRQRYLQRGIYRGVYTEGYIHRYIHRDIYRGVYTEGYIHRDIYTEI